MYLILSTPSIDYANAISRELWRLVRPFENETTQFYVGRYAHPDGTKVCIGPIEGSQPIHNDANEYALGELIGLAVTAEEEEFITATIAEAKGGSLDVLAMLESIESLSPNLRTRAQLESDGWFSTDEV